MRPLAGVLPDFPWDHLQPFKQRAAEHPDGIVDLSVGTPVDPTPPLVRQALGAAAEAPGYPTTVGTPKLRQAIVDYLARRFGVGGLDVDAILPALGAKELIAWLPVLLGLGPQDLMVIPQAAYPTYAVGGTMAGCEVVATDDLASLGSRRPAMVWLNSPANPTGRVMSADELAKAVAWARERGALVVCDECYLEFTWDAEPVSILHPDVSGGSTDGVLAVHSLSKRSNMAGYRAGFVVGDPEVVRSLLAVRKHAGMIMPLPIQAAVAAAVGDDDHVEEQRARYATRREILQAAFTGAGLEIAHSEGALYLWVTRGESCWDTVGWLAELGILVTPGDFYGAAGERYVRVAFTATDERVAAAAARLSQT